MFKTILGFDVSSSTIGWCTLTWDEATNTIAFVKADYLKPIKKGSIIERIVDTRNKIQLIINDVKPDYIGIEDIIKFMAGKSSAQTIIMLTTFNRMIGLCSYDYLHKSPQLFSVMTIRHGLKLDNTFPKKEDMPALVAQRLGIIFPYQLGKKGALKVENFDMADGIAVALYYALFLSGQTKVKRKGKKK